MQGFLRKEEKGLRMEWKGRKQKRTGPWRKPLCQKQSMRALSPGAKTGMKGQGIAPAPSTEWQCKQESKPGHCNRETLKASWCNTIKARFLLTGQPHTDTAAWGRSSKWLSRYPGSCHLQHLAPKLLCSIPAGRKKENGPPQLSKPEPGFHLLPPLHWQDLSYKE